MDKIYNNIVENSWGIVLTDESMKFHTTMRVGGKVKYFIKPNTINNLISILKLLKENNINVNIIGKGSNLVFSEKNHHIAVISLEDINSELKINKNTVKIGAEYSFMKLAREISKLGLSGLEFAGGIPGSVGGAVYMNAGAHSGDVSSILKKVTYLDENYELKYLNNEECKFQYRHSIFQDNLNWIIIEAEFEFEIGDQASIYKRMAGNLEYRKEMQPLEKPSCGSVFRNPKNDYSGRLIEELNLKGYNIGDAKVSDKHANFIINDGNASGDEIIELIEYVKEIVLKEYNEDLKVEIEIRK